MLFTMFFARGLINLINSSNVPTNEATKVSYFLLFDGSRSLLDSIALLKVVAGAEDLDVFCFE
jgi:hypothetical protein